MNDVFLSHASDDKKDYVRPFARELDERSISYWLDEADIEWGDSIANEINNGLQRSRFAVIFLSERFMQRNWTKTELQAAISKENSQERKVVLPIMIGDHEEILEKQPLLKDKNFVEWEDGVEAIVDQLENLLYALEPKQKVEAIIEGTNHTVDVEPDIIISFLADLGTHSLYSPDFFAEELEKAGFLTAVSKDRKSIEINGITISKDKGAWGEPGIWSLNVARSIYKLTIGERFKGDYIGRGRRYRQLVTELRTRYPENS
jgi:hypothetical protein